eukprot:CAMPEP_0197913002 /NCGR_PEP_ID=MMETSP1439-20131203/75858_1 /TAXON_ID=66791 /ORGANISM="Gonyaulax spinifera, Strain CCMP409" /LENGTH=335 /DNA_ID=CAMNT_0043534829 /DNA_START=1 /DNA_END=1008 /DNA_ORIENTATION=+
MMGWFELLCCPTAMGCTIVEFEPKNPEGGEPKYKIKLRLSHSEHVPRYQLHVIKDGKTMPWLVGHMEKTETHLRAKPGEFVRVQIWKLTCNSMVQEKRPKAQEGKRCFSKAATERPTPSATDIQMCTMSIASQAKLDLVTGEEGEANTLDKDSERWVQVISSESRAYRFVVDHPRGGNMYHKSLKSIGIMQILYRGKKVCVARKQRFAGALGKVEQPFLGVQIDPTKLAKPSEEENIIPCLLDTNSLMLLLMCLAWSEETMTPHLDMSKTLAQAMRADPSERGSAVERGLSVQWDTEDVMSRLKRHDWARLHNWSKPPRLEEPEDADEQSSDNDG